MKKVVQNSFSKGLNFDLNPLSTPKDVLTDCVNGTIITYNGDEFTLQTDQGNVKVGTNITDAVLPKDFIPLGMKEYGGIIYIVAHNPITRETQIGSLPSPQRYLTFDTETDNLTKYINDLQGNPPLSSAINITHNMNLLNAYITSGDKFTISIKITDLPGSLTYTDLLKKLINKYENVNDKGYFSFEYFSMDSNGVLTPLNIDLINDINYGTIGNEGVEKVYTENSKGIITLFIKPLSIDTFDFNIIPNVDELGIIRALLNIVADDITSDTAIKVNTIKIEHTVTSPSQPLSETGIKYYEYDPNIASINLTIENSTTGGTSITFEDGTILTITATPIDQFGRELIDKAVTKSVSLNMILTGTQAHTVFQYKTNLAGDSINLKYDFLFEGVGEPILATNIEFYDFWSDVTTYISNIPFDIGTENSSRQVTIDIPLTLNRVKNQTFINGSEYGGILQSDLASDSSGFNLLGSNPKKVLSYKNGTIQLRPNHCYIVRIFGIETSSNTEYNIFQLLYTNGVFNSNTEDNFGTIDIMTILGSTEYIFGVNKTGIFSSGNQIYSSPSVSYISSDNYSNSYTTPLTEPYRIYGGPTKCEVRVDESASPYPRRYEIATNNVKYFRHSYTGLFSESVDIGKHNIPELAVKFGLIPNTYETSFGVNPDNVLVNDSSIIDTLLKKNGSIKNFTFEATINYTGLFSNLSGTTSLYSNLLFGVIDNSLFRKRIVINGNQLINSTASTSSNITNNPSTSISWSGTNVGFSPISSFIGNLAITNNVLDSSINITGLTIGSQRFISSPSSFSLFNILKTRYKTFDYFGWEGTDALVTIRPTAENFNNTVGISEGPSRIVNSPNNDIFAAYIRSYFRDNILGDLFSTGLNIPYSIANIGETDIYPTLGGVHYDSLEATGKLLLAETLTPNNTYNQTIFETFLSRQPRVCKIGAFSGLESRPILYLTRFPTGSLVYYAYTSLQDFSKAIVAKQRYKELFIAQFATSTQLNYTDLSRTESIISGSLEYFTQNFTNKDNDSLTLSSFGTADLIKLNITNLKNTINSKWVGILTDGVTNINDNTKLLYNFLDTSLSIGAQKNIPYSYTEKRSANISIPSLSFRLDVGVPTNIISYYANAEINMKANRLQDDPYVTPVSKVIVGNDIREANPDWINSTYFTTDTPNTENLMAPMINLINVNIPFFQAVPQTPIAHGITGATVSSSTPSLTDLYI